MDDSDLMYQKSKNQIQVLTDEVVRCLNENDLDGARMAYKNLALLYHQIGYFDLEGRTDFYLAKLLKTNHLSKDFEIALDSAYSCYLKAINLAPERKLQQNNNDFLDSLADAYISIGAYNKATECALMALRVYSVGFDLPRTVSILYNIEDLKDNDLDHYLYSSFGQQNIKDIKINMERRRNRTFYDPIEDTPIYRYAFREIKDHVREEALKENAPVGSKRYFEIKKAILKNEYGIDWDSPIDIVLTQ